MTGRRELWPVLRLVHKSMAIPKKKSLLKISSVGHVLPGDSLRVLCHRRVPGGQEDGLRPEHVQVNILGLCDVWARLRLSHRGTPATDRVGLGVMLGPHSAQDAPRDGPAQCLQCRKRGDLL